MGNCCERDWYCLVNLGLLQLCSYNFGCMDKSCGPDLGLSILNDSISTDSMPSALLTHLQLDVVKSGVCLWADSSWFNVEQK